MSSKNERISALDGLRGIAVILVIFHHGIRSVAENGFVPARLITIGESLHIGVDLFFVLSGFLITSILLRERESPRYFAPFYWRRSLRILPLYFLTLLILAFLVPSELGPTHLPWYIFFASNLYIVIHGFGHELLRPLWSLALEEQFYAVWPVINRYVKPSLLAIAAGVIIISQPLLRHLLVGYSYTNPIVRLDGLLVGSLLAITWPRVQEFFRTKSQPILWLSVGYLAARTLFTEMRYYSQSSFFIAFDFSLISICFGIIMASALASSSKQLTKLLNTRTLHSAGKYSYSMYLVHSIVCYVLVEAGTVPRLSDPLGASVAAISWTLLVWAISTGIARITWKYIESPILQHKDRIGYAEASGEVKLRSA